MHIVGMKGRGRLKIKWLGVIVSDMNKTGMDEENQGI